VVLVFLLAPRAADTVAMWFEPYLLVMGPEVPVSSSLRLAL